MATHRSILKTTRFRRLRGSTNADANVRSLHQEWKQICGAQCLAQAFGAPLRGFRALHFSGVSDQTLVLVGLVGLVGLLGVGFYLLEDFGAPPGFSF